MVDEREGKKFFLNPRNAPESNNAYSWSMLKLVKILFSRLHL